MICHEEVYPTGISKTRYYLWRRSHLHELISNCARKLIATRR
ncbi:MAG: hypothetical protein ACTS73_09975 [Arsenophonus sp. NEOnobi-MAG3]